MIISFGPDDQVQTVADSVLPGSKVILDSYFWALIPSLNFIANGGCVHLRYYALRAWGYAEVYNESTFSPACSLARSLARSLALSRLCMYREWLMDGLSAAKRVCGLQGNHHVSLLKFGKSTVSSFSLNRGKRPNSKTVCITRLRLSYPIRSLGIE